MKLPLEIKVNGWTKSACAMDLYKIQRAIDSLEVGDVTRDMLVKSADYMQRVLNVFELINLGKEYIKESVDELNDDMAGPHG